MEWQTTSPLPTYPSGGIGLATGRGIIGHRLLRSGMIWVPRVDDFIDPRHRAIWDIIQNILRATNAADVDSVSVLLRFCANTDALSELHEIVKTIATKTIEA